MCSCVLARFAAFLGLVAVFALPPAGAGADQPGEIFTYTVSARGEVVYPREAFIEDVRRIFADVRSVHLGGSIRLEMVSRDADVNIVLASPEVIGSAAAVCDDDFSCRVGDEVLINDENWRRGTPAFDGGLDTYRRYLLNHETGHFLGLDHRPCPGGGPAPLMMQQSKGTGACHPHGFPLPVERRRIAELQGVRALEPIPAVIQRAPIITTRTGDGYWVVDELGRVRAFGDASNFGSVDDYYSLDTGVVAAAAQPPGHGHGYFLSAFGGELYAFDSGGRDAASEVGSTSGLRLEAPIVAMAAGPGGGYWQAASDGGVFAFGNAAFHGSAGSIPLAAPIVGMAPTPTGDGYWLVASDGGVFAFGNAAFHGSAGSIPLAAPIVGMAPTPTGDGYWLNGADGGVFTYGGAEFLGSAAS